jgi:hypothetical protein
MKEELSLYGNEYSLFDTFYNGKWSIPRRMQEQQLIINLSGIPGLPSAISTATF